MSRPIFIDIDGTLTSAPTRPWGPVYEKRLERVRDLITKGETVVLWSARGTTYAKKFAEQYALNGVLPLGKPELIVDDNPTIRPREKMPIKSPLEFFGK